MSLLFIPVRRRRRRLAVTLVLLGFAFLVFLASTKSPHRLNVVDRTVLMLAAPMQKGATAVYRFAGGVWRDYVALVGLQAENRRLASEVEALHERLGELREVELENRRLRALLDFVEQQGRPMFAARVVGYDPSSRYRTVRIDRGSDGGVRRGMPVVTHRGVVGRVLRAWSNYADVLLLTDPQSGVDALIQRTRARGTVEGLGTDALRLKYLLRLDEVREGDLVVTSGFDSVFPAGLVIGTVRALHRRASDVFQEVRIAPAVDLDHVEEVVVLALLEPPGAIGLDECRCDPGTVAPSPDVGSFERDMTSSSVPGEEPPP